MIQKAPVILISNPVAYEPLFEPFEIKDLNDPKFLSTLKECKGQAIGDIIYVQVRRSLDGVTENGEVRFPDGSEVRFPDGNVVKIHEYLVSVVFRWDGLGWVGVAPFGVGG